MTLVAIGLAAALGAGACAAPTRSSHPPETPTGSTVAGSVVSSAAVMSTTTSATSAAASSTDSAKSSSSTDSATSSSSADKATSTASATAAGNRALASAEARRLLALVALPSGATHLAHPPASLGQPGLGIGAGGSLIDVTSYWSVPLSQQAAVAWINSHVPAGLVAVGSGSTTGAPGAGPVAGYGFSDKGSPAWAQALMEVTVTPVDAQHTAWRTDGMAVWLDPEPAKDDAAGSRLRVTVAGGCPASDAQIVGVEKVSTASTTALLPPATPTAALICHYAGFRGTWHSLAAHRVLSANTAQELADQVRSVAVSHQDGAIPTPCAMGDGSTDVLAFSYAHQPDLDIWLVAGGCGTLGNGRIATNRTGNLDDAITAALK